MHKKLRSVSRTAAAPAALFAAFWISVAPGTESDAQVAPLPQTATATFDFDTAALHELGWHVAAQGTMGPDGTEEPIVLPVEPSFVPAPCPGATALQQWNQAIPLRGALLLSGDAGRVVIGNPIVTMDGTDRWALADSLYDHTALFEMTSVLLGCRSDGSLRRLLGELIINVAGAEALGRPDLAGTTVGVLTIEFGAARPDRLPDEPGPTPPDNRGGTIGPDIVVADLQNVVRFGSFGAITAYGVGTTACNYGDENANWIADTNEHPVISQSMFRLKDGRFEQIGMSWVKHGFYAVSSDFCNLGCPEPTDGTQLGVGCSDPYSASLNGAQGNMSMRSEVDAFTGYFPYPFDAPPAEPTIGRRLQVQNTDLNPALNAGALYFVEGHYVAADDAAAGNQNNNASYRPAVISGGGGVYNVLVVDLTQTQKPGIRAWKDTDPTVMLTIAGIPGEGRFRVGSQATDLGNGFWRYEYAVQNETSHRSGRSFAVPLPDGVTAQNTGFKDVPYHSGEPLDGTDWPVSIGSGEVRWATETFDVNPNANALRWGTLYNFWFDADTLPVTSVVAMGLFRPGEPDTAYAQAVVPSALQAVCGDGFIGEGEECDPPDGVHCDGNCQWICGDGVVQEGEDCDPPDGETCDEDCLRIPACGDGFVDAGEQCDPPNGATCDPACQWVDHDDCVNAVALCPGSFDASTIGRTVDGASACDGTVPGADVWFAYTPLVTGTLSVDTCGSVLNTVLSIHNGCPGAGIELTCNNDACGQQSSVSLPVTSGNTYWIRTAGYNGAVGNVILNLSGPPCLTGPPVNDDCPDTLVAGEGTTPFTTLQATTDGPDEPDACDPPGPSQIESDIWYCYQPSCTGMATISLCDSDFDTMLAVYPGCTCPQVPSALACDDDACSPQSELTVPTTAGQTVLIRIGGAEADSGTGNLDITCNGPGDPFRGGQLWDQWWAVNGSPAPTGNHPLYPPEGSQSGSTTYRCKECHGWDYQGVDGAYGSGSHYTGIPGVLGSTLTPGEMFDLIRSADVPNGHGFENLGLTHQDIWDLVEFLQTLVIDTDAYVDETGAILGDPVAGETNYTTGGSISCITCHGADGTAINFGTTDNPEWVGTIAWYNPWEFLHKVRFGQPGSPMPSWIADGGTDQGAADIGRFAQIEFPVDCTEASHCDDAVFCNGAESCLDGFCEPGGDPCPSGICDELLPGCLSGLCDPPGVVVAGCRQIAVTPAAGGTPVAVRLTGDPQDPNVLCLTEFVQLDGTLGPEPDYQLPGDWGTVYVKGPEIRPSTFYRVRTDCGSPGSPDLSLSEAGTTWLYGDVNDDGDANFVDIFLEVKGFQGDFSGAPLEALDIALCTPEGDINFNDINAAVRGFQSQGLPCTPPCP